MAIYLLLSFLARCAKNALKYCMKDSREEGEKKWEASRRK
jgi:hypothetical protein